MQGKRHGHGSHMNFQGEKLVQRYTGLKTTYDEIFFSFFLVRKKGALNGRLAKENY